MVSSSMVMLVALVPRMAVVTEAATWAAVSP